MIEDLIHELPEECDVALDVVKESLFGFRLVFDVDGAGTLEIHVFEEIEAFSPVDESFGGTAPDVLCQRVRAAVLGLTFDEDVFQCDNRKPLFEDCKRRLEVFSVDSEMPRVGVCAKVSWIESFHDMRQGSGVHAHVETRMGMIADFDVVSGCQCFPACDGVMAFMDFLEVVHDIGLEGEIS